MTTRARGAALGPVYAVLAFAIPLSLSLTAPLSPQGGDTVPAKLGMHVLQCEQSFDLGGVSWLREQALAGKRPYYAVVTEDQTRLVSTWGPAPALWGSLTTMPLPVGLDVDDETLARRARKSAALAVGLACLFLFMAIAERNGATLALVGALTAGLSFAGAAVLGQALWQQTVALPFLAASWWGLSRGVVRPGRPYPLVAACVLATAAGWIRPADAVVALTTLVLAGRALLETRSRATIGLALAGVAFVVAAFASWNQFQFGTWFPVGQAITHRGEESLFVNDPGAVGLALAALLWSPSRGLLVFAPVVVVAIVTGARSNRVARSLSLALLVQLVVCSAFYKWWGGVTFGPRLTASLVWASCFVLFGLVDARAIPKRLAAATVAVTVAVGLVGLYGYDPRKWDLLLGVDASPEVVWSVPDNVVLASLRPLPPDSPSIQDSPSGPFRYCVARTLSPE
ncbi:MAG: hypothetical protein AAF997_00580 [Myxococcota bacterium]